MPPSTPPARARRPRSRTHAPSSPPRSARSSTGVGRVVGRPRPRRRPRSRAGERRAFPSRTWRTMLGRAADPRERRGSGSGPRFANVRRRGRANACRERTRARGGRLRQQRRRWTRGRLDRRQARPAAEHTTPSPNDTGSRCRLPTFAPGAVVTADARRRTQPRARGAGRAQLPLIGGSAVHFGLGARRRAAPPHRPLPGRRRDPSLRGRGRSRPRRAGASALPDRKTRPASYLARGCRSSLAPIARPPASGTRRRGRVARRAHPRAGARPLPPVRGDVGRVGGLRPEGARLLHRRRSSTPRTSLQPGVRRSATPRTGSYCGALPTAATCARPSPG